MLSFGNILSGKKEFLLVGGYSGIGKTALIYEIHRPVTSARGYFASGKFEQLQSGIPYSAFIHAFTGLIDYFLTESEENLNNWKKLILEAVGDIGSVLTEILPNLELIIGKQKEVEKLGGNENQNRFNYVFQNFLRAICQKSPVVLFIDDFQWADIPSLNLLYSLLTDVKNNRLLIIGAYRNNEVSPTHPFMMKVNELEKENLTISKIELNHLSLDHVKSLMADTINKKVEEVQELSENLYVKSGGNAFFLRQLLLTIYENDILYFDYEKRTWNWKLDELKKLSISDNVADLVSKKIERFPKESIRILHLASCIGNQFHLKTLSVISQKSEMETANFIYPMLVAGLIVPLSDYLKPVEGSKEKVDISYKFLHDKVQQAAYQWENEKSRSLNHLKIGELLLSNWKKEEQEEHLFDIVYHLNFAEDLIESKEDKLQLIHLNLESSKKAIRATAYIPALKYIQKSLNALDSFENIWENYYQLSLEVYEVYAEANYLTSNFEVAEKYLLEIIQNAKSLLAKGNAYKMLVVEKTMKAEYAEAIRLGMEALELLGYPIPSGDRIAHFMEMHKEIQEILRDKKIPDILHNPDMVDEDKKLAINILLNMDAPAYIYESGLYIELSGFASLLSLKFGNAPDSGKGFANYGTLIQILFGEFSAGYEFGILGIAIAEKFKNISQKAKSLNQLANWIQPWVKHLEESNLTNRITYETCMETGEFQYAGYSLQIGNACDFLAGTQLQNLQNTLNSVFAFAEKTQNTIIQDATKGVRLVYDNLLGNTNSQESFSNKEISEEEFYSLCGSHQNNYSIACFQTFKLLALCIYGNWKEALKLAEEAEPNLPYVMGLFYVPLHTFTHTLVMIKNYRDLPPEKQNEFNEKIDKNIDQIIKWSKPAPFNQEARLSLLQAERLAISNEPMKAIPYYQEALKSAKENRFIQEEALIHELTAEFWKKQSVEVYFDLHITSAYNAYKVWGAERKSKSLEKFSKKNLHSLSTKSVSLTNSTITSSGLIDLTSVIRASQTISGEIQLDSLLRKMMRILFENAGAERGFFILKEKEDWNILASGEAQDNSIKILERVSIQNTNELSSGMVNYVIRTKEQLILGNASQKGNFTNDIYVKEKLPKSILVYPIISQGKLIGIVYLENNLITDAFTLDRIEILQILSSQVAISVENSILYANLENKVKERTLELEEAHKKILILEKENTEKQLAGGFAHEIRNALAGPKLVIQQILGYDRGEPHTSIMLENSRQLKEIYISLKDIIPSTTLENILSSMKLIFSNEEFLDNGLKMIYKSTLRGLSITQEIMNYSKIGYETIGNNKINLNSFLTSIVNDYRDSLIKENISIQLQTSQKEFHLIGLESHFESVFKNLINNAKDALLDKNLNGERKRQINISSNLENDKCVIEFTDNGIGIPKENLTKIYDAFFSTKPDTGTGLGLGVTNKIVGLYGGNISVTSNPKQGTTFKVTFPIRTE